jgi:hypothetical protein
LATFFFAFFFAFSQALRVEHHAFEPHAVGIEEVDRVVAALVIVVGRVGDLDAEAPSGAPPPRRGEG